MPSNSIISKIYFWGMNYRTVATQLVGREVTEDDQMLNGQNAQAQAQEAASATVPSSRLTTRDCKCMGCNSRFVVIIYFFL